MFTKVLIVCLLMCVIVTGQEAQQRSRVSDAQLHAALSDTRYLKRQIQCALGKAPCDPVGRRLKNLAPLVLRGACPQCTPEEAQQIKTVLAYIQHKHPKEWSKVIKQYIR